MTSSRRDRGRRSVRGRGCGVGRHNGCAVGARDGRRVQAAKAGILEIGNVYCVNKADRDGADATRGAQDDVGDRAQRRGSGRLVVAAAVVKTVASRGEGSTSSSPRSTPTASTSRLPASLSRAGRPRPRARSKLSWWQPPPNADAGRGVRELDSLAADVVSGVSDPFTAAATLRALLGAMTHSFRDCKLSQRHRRALIHRSDSDARRTASFMSRSHRPNRSEYRRRDRLRCPLA